MTLFLMKRHGASNLDCFNPHASSFSVMYFQKESSRAFTKSIESLLQFENLLEIILLVLSKFEGHLDIDVFTWFKICTKESTGYIYITLLALQSKQSLQDQDKH